MPGTRLRYVKHMHPPHIKIVDDGVRASLVDLLRDAGYRTRTAKNDNGAVASASCASAACASCGASKVSRVYGAIAFCDDCLEVSTDPTLDLGGEQ